MGDFTKIVVKSGTLYKNCGKMLDLSTCFDEKRYII